MTWSCSGIAVLCTAALLISACGSDDAKAKPDASNEPDAGSADVAPDTSKEPDVAVTDCQTDGCAIGDTCTDSGQCVSTPCSIDDQCSDGAACAPSVDGRTCQAPTGVPDGEGCTQDSDCQGGSCITDWPGGFCTTMDCSTFEDCSRLGNENRCLQVEGPDFCARLCTSDAECRDGYFCERLNSQEGACLPEPEPSVPFPTILTGNPFAVSCVNTVNGTATIPFSVASDTTAYMVTPFTKDGQRITPRNISNSSNNGIDFGNANAFQTIPSLLYGDMNPTIVPPAPLFRSQFETGMHEYRVDTTSKEVCWYMFEESTPGDTLDLNIYLVGIPGLNAATAPTHRALQKTLDGFDTLYQTAGVHLGKIRYFDVSPTIEQEYAIVKDEASLPALLMESKRPGTTMDDVLSANLFFVRGMDIGGAMGISRGLPGPAGLHGSQGSGVVFTAEYMGDRTTDAAGNLVDGNLFTARVLAHEVGHYLGLFHTSESSGTNHDVLADTAECRNISLSCPDITNLMFPFAGSTSSIITPDQAFVLGVNPLTKMANAGGDQ